MTTIDRLDGWKAVGVISEEQHAMLTALVRRERFSVFVELSALLYLGVPLCAALSVTHGFVPPHPGPTAVAAVFHADLNMTLLYGVILAIPATFLGGPVLSRFYKGWNNQPPPELYTHKELADSELPSFTVSLTTILIPVVLMMFGAVVAMTTDAKSSMAQMAKFLSDANVALQPI